MKKFALTKVSKQISYNETFLTASTLLFWENQVGKIVLMDLNELKKVADIKEATQKIQLVESVFGMRADQHSTVSLKRFDAEWWEFVDVEEKEVKNRDKLKVKIVENNLYTRKPLTQTTSQEIGSIMQAIFQNKAKEVNRDWVGNIGQA